MPKNLEIRDIEIDGKVDRCGWLFISGDSWIKRNEAKQIIDHLIEVFGFGDGFARKKERWIDIKKQRPHHRQNVIAVGTWWGELAGYGEDDYMGIGSYDGDGVVGIDSDGYATKIRNVTHWMPLPKWPE